MIKTRIGLHNIETTVENPVLIKVVEDIKKYLGFNNDIYYTLDEKENVSKSKNKLGKVESYGGTHSEYFDIKHESGADEEYELSMVPLNPDYRHIYRDNDVDASLTPVYIRRKHTLTVRYYNKSKSKVNSLTNRLRIKPNSSDLYIMHDLEYYYVLPGFVTSLIDEINTLKNTRLVTAIDLNTYINNTFDDRVDMINAEDGDRFKVDVGIREKQLSVLGTVRTGLSDIRAQFDEEQSSWYVEIEYVFTYESPIQLSAKYPIIIYNNLIGKKFRESMPETKARFVGKHTAGTAPLMEIVDSKLSKFLTIPKTSYYKSIPADDTFVAPRPDPYTARIISILSMVDTVDQYALFNVSDIPDIKFKDVVLDLMKVEHLYMSRPYESLFYFELLKDGVKDYTNKVLVDANLNLTTLLPMELTSIYRVVINAIVDLNVLSSANLLRLESYVAGLQANVPENELVPIVDYYLELLDIPLVPIGSLGQYPSNDLQFILRIDNNAWKKYYTVQTHIVLAGIMEEK